MFATYSGVLIDPVNIKTEHINLIDIAHHLTKICRYGGSLDFGLHYSVAEHSLILCEYVLTQTNDLTAAKYALMHDASEAYLGDVVSGLKPHLDDYKQLETHFTDIILQKYGIEVSQDMLSYVTSCDKRMLLDEVLALCPNRYHLYKKPNVSKLGLKSITISDDDWGDYPPGGSTQQAVYEKFLYVCDVLKIGD